MINLPVCPATATRGGSTSRIPNTLGERLKWSLVQTASYYRFDNYEGTHGYPCEPPTLTCGTRVGTERGRRFRRRNARPVMPATALLPEGCPAEPTRQPQPDSSAVVPLAANPP